MRPSFALPGIGAEGTVIHLVFRPSTSESEGYVGINYDFTGNRIVTDGLREKVESALNAIAGAERRDPVCVVDRVITAMQ